MNSPDLSLTDLQSIDALLDRFERAWGTGEQQSIEDCLLEFEPRLKPAALRELVRLEVELQLMENHPVSSADYSKRFPEESVELKRLVEECCRRWFERSDRQADVSLESTVLGNSSSIREPSAAGNTDNELPAEIGRFRIARRLGAGQFGEVYEAWDTDLDRQVAIKVPRVAGRESLRQFLQEARAAARLRHPGIVAVHDVVREGLSLYVVLEYVAGQTLADLLKSEQLSTARTPELLAQIAEAVAYAHSHGLIHRDLKPANILLDSSGTPHVADFGLALHQSVRQAQRGVIAGTLAYMSPEQIRGETHRLDGRSDIWSLGVMLYEMLMGQLPFSGQQFDELSEAICHRELQPLRVSDPSVPEELERICLKCLSKRTRHRYSTASEIAADLRRWLRDTSKALRSQSTHRIVPHGLQAFDEHDAEFFLQLLPGPRDRDGLPDSLRFWKTRIEQFEASETFAVGLMYGPTGCGKSSLVKAGLLPLLSDRVAVAAIDATRDDTPQLLLQTIRAHVPELPEALNLAEALAEIREGTGLPLGHKLLLVIDQFEQWLHGREVAEYGVLLEALRHCDGARLQTVLLVRDDFWLAVNRFMQALELPVLEDQNNRLVDLFDLPHARHVLCEFGRAYGCLPPNLADLSPEQSVFLEEATQSLSESGKVACVRLALLAEMLRNQPWVPETLQRLGGLTGIGVTYLEETFSGPGAPPSHRLHEQSARRALSHLLPEPDANIRGAKRSAEELRRAAGCNQQHDFTHLMQILDTKTRLVTPTDPPVTADSESTATTAAETPPGDREPDTAGYYQLTHDYLVPALREWLTRGQRATRRGRAELLLTERARLWDQKPNRKGLPSLIEWMGIRLWTKSARWNPGQQRMMLHADRYHGLRLALSSLLLITMTAFGLHLRQQSQQLQQETRLDGLLTALTSASLDQVPPLIEQLSQDPSRAVPRLEAELAQHPEGSPPLRNLRLALLPHDSSQLAHLESVLLAAEPTQIPIYARLVAGHEPELTETLWTRLNQSSAGNPEAFLATVALLAHCESELSDQWPTFAEQIVQTLINQRPTRALQWAKTLHAIRQPLITPLTDIFRAPPGTHSAETDDLVTSILERYAQDDFELLAEFILDAQPQQFDILFDEFAAFEDRAIQRIKSELRTITQSQVTTRPPNTSNETARNANYEALVRRGVNSALLQLRMNQPEEVWPLLEHSPNPELRSWLIYRASRAKVSPELFTERLHVETISSIRSAIVLALGGYDEVDVPELDDLQQTLLAWYESDPDPGLHASIRWTLSQWGQRSEVAQSDQRLAANSIDLSKQWYLTTQNHHTFTVVPGPVKFAMGAPPDEVGYQTNETRHIRRIDRSFAIGTTETTAEQYNIFLQWQAGSKQLPAPNDISGPAGVSWYEAAQYCRWLSEQEGIPEDQMCYPSINEIKEGMTIPDDYLRRTGYRLPTEAEWEYSCRAGTTSSRFFGESSALLKAYVHMSSKTVDVVAKYRPNNLGLFDVYGNSFEWCHGTGQPYAIRHAQSPLLDEGEITPPTDEGGRALRSAPSNRSPNDFRSAYRTTGKTRRDYSNFGFRIAKTVSRVQ